MFGSAQIYMATIGGWASLYTSIWQSFSQKGCIIYEQFRKHDLFHIFLAVSYKSDAYKTCL